MFFLPHASYEVRVTDKTGRGVFAKQDLLPGIVIGDYLGTVIRSIDEDKYDDDDRNFYLMYYHDYASIFPNPKTVGVHILNHSCEPNCWLYTYKGHTLFFTLRKIFAGEELTIAYLLSPQDKYCNPCTHLCKCGSNLCCATMHLTKEKYDKWRSFDDKIAAKTKRDRVKYDKPLIKLGKYPNNIADNIIYDLFGNKSKKPVEYLDNTLPSQEILRSKVRETGRQLAFIKLNVKIVGFLNQAIIARSI